MPFDKEGFKELLRAGKRAEAAALVGARGIWPNGHAIWPDEGPAREVRGAAKAAVDELIAAGQWPALTFDPEAFKALLRAGKGGEACCMVGAAAFTPAGGMCYGNFRPSEEIRSAALAAVDEVLRAGQWPGRAQRRG